jgi:hypothetical protein
MGPVLRTIANKGRGEMTSQRGAMKLMLVADQRLEVVVKRRGNLPMLNIHAIVLALPNLRPLKHRVSGE